MASLSQRWEDNAPGKYYIDANCIFCNLCMEVAPRHFKEADTGDHDYVLLQPETQEEIALVEDAKAQCPVDAIGDNGV